MITITRIQAWAFRSPTKKPVATSFGVMHDRPAVLVRVEDRDGAFGWGEIWANWPAAGAEHRLRLLEMDVAHLVLGVEFASPTDFFYKLDAQTRVRAVQCGEVGPFAQVIAGLDIALWDLAARREGVPLRRLIREDAPDTIPAYASGIQIFAADDLMLRARNDGHHRFKLKVGFDMATDVGSVHRIQSELAQNELIACDANQAWSLEQAKAFLNGIKGVPLHWLEEPLPVFHDTVEWQSLADYAGVALAGGGEHNRGCRFRSRHQNRRFIRDPARCRKMGWDHRQLCRGPQRAQKQSPLFPAFSWRRHWYGRLGGTTGWCGR